MVKCNHLFYNGQKHMLRNGTETLTTYFQQDKNHKIKSSTQKL
jgi:hypothetical protein